jgi:pyrroline-5-carboxylate reductase
MGVDLSGKRVAVLGAGKMGGILLKALLEKGLLRRESTCATVAHEERAKSLSQKLGIAVGTDNVAAVHGRTTFYFGGSVGSHRPH